MPARTATRRTHAGASTSAAAANANANNDANNRPHMVEDAGIERASLACGDWHTAALTSDGVVYTWGRGGHGQLGHGDTSRQITPKRVEALARTSVRALACGDWHTAALTSDGVVYTWGRGDDGQLGHGDTSCQLTPKRVDAIPPIAIDVHQSSAIPTVESFHIEDRSDEELGQLAQFASRLHDAADAEIDRRICDALAHEHDEYVCPITHTVMTDPVVASDGHSYERSAIERWLGDGNTRSPKTNVALSSTHVFANQALRKGIRHAMEAARASFPDSAQAAHVSDSKRARTS